MQGLIAHNISWPVQGGAHLVQGHWVKSIFSFGSAFLVAAITSKYQK
jgi:hypothetical protein